jgi:hypothetical protein
MQPTQGEGPWSSADYRNGSDIDSDNYPATLTVQQQRQAYTDQLVAAFGRSGGNEAGYPSTQLADASGNYFGIPPSDSRGFFPGGDDASNSARRPGEPVPGSVGPRRTGPDAFTDGVAKSFAEDAAARKAAAGSDLRTWLSQENPVLGPIKDAVTDFGIDVGRNSPVVGGAIQAVRWAFLGDGSNADSLLAAVGPLAKVEGRIGLTVEERFAARVDAAEAQRAAAKLARFEATETVEITGRTAANELSRSYQGAVASLYGQPARDVPYLASVDGNPTWLRADTVAQVGGRETAIEAKYVDDWARSPRNPANDRPFPPDAPMDRTERATMLEQARQYSVNFAGGAVYHTNSVELATYWNKAFLDAGLQNIRFIITPTVRR